ncbi:hypothetical protein EBQ90_10710 [bacterium]|nr:hypothetical protein [bacterium]
MKQISVLFLVLSFAIVSLAEHQKNTVSPQARPKEPRPCPGYDRMDPFSLNVRYSQGPRAGECMNLYDYRPAHLLSPEEALQYAEKAKLPPPKPGEIWVANIWHRGKFWVVRVPELAVEDVMLLKERFDPGIPIIDFMNKRRWFAAHAEVRFKLKKGKEAIFIPQKLDDDSGAILLSDLVVSPEAVRPRGEAFGPLKGNRDYYGLAKRVLSLEEAVDVSIRKLKHQIAQYPINVKAEEADQKRQEYLLSALKRSDRDWTSYRQGKPVYYHTETRNCISETVDIFDEATDYARVSKAQENVPERRPRNLLPAMSARGLLSKQPYPTLNREFGYPNY